MSQSRIAKLEALLARVERRRAEPRLVPVGNVPGYATANNNIAERPSMASMAERSQTMPAPRRAGPAMSAGLTGGIATPMPAPVEAAITQLALDPPARRASSLPPPPEGSDSPRHPLTPPPGATPATPLAPVRIEPQPLAPLDSAVKVVSAARVDTPRTFGDLLSLSLSLRPR
jgi:hypothetical protein